jgi:hypothetical protein
MFTCAADLIRHVYNSWYARHAIGLRAACLFDVRGLFDLHFTWHDVLV